MRADLPTEEDVLAVGLLCWFVYETEEGGRGVPSEWADDFSGAACAVWHARRDALGTLGAIADSERRFEVERAERAVLDAAKVYHDARCNYANGVDGPDIEEAADAVDDAASRMEDARVMAGVYDAEVSRHGG